MPPLRRVARLALAAIYLVVAAAALVPSGILVVAGETAAGRLAGVVAAILCLLPALGWAAVTWRRRGRAALAVALALVAGLGAVLFAIQAPGRALPGSRVRSVFLGDRGYDRLAIASVVPEIDQIKLGTYLIAAVDPVIDLAAAKHVRDVSMALYRPMESDPEYRALGSVMGDAYADRDAGHAYEYVPEHREGERLPVLLFLHGSFGSFKAYFYAWRRFADAHRWIVVCPSFGWGNWYRPGGVEAVERARAHALASLPADRDRVYLAGLSNGGTGATRAAAREPDHYAGLVLLSAVIERDVVSSPSFRRGWAGRPVLVIHGDGDDRIPIHFVDEAVSVMRRGGALVTYEVLAGEDHFLFFSALDRALADLGAWVSPVGAPAPPAAP